MQVTVMDSTLLHRFVGISRAHIRFIALLWCDVQALTHTFVSPTFEPLLWGSCAFSRNSRYTSLLSRAVYAIEPEEPSCAAKVLEGFNIYPVHTFSTGE